ncbi:OmpA family protein [Xinfangfangia sp. CPCC 101601]|uniref:OmpA family protein n=1 Tax=Pseudogemmobacter lacusdianii TaxID=3069608 RepID=A0ABU0VT33_9RHOB|nr:OmpA family protein [Xinfangfangia sp. CPCC 101601]MDQ2064889.1 OmpA family protein [Xinfangfangia sp. CPCC 101601]
MTRMFQAILSSGALLTLAACGESTTSFDRELGAGVDGGQFGNATMHNTLLQSGEMEYTVALAQRFSNEVPDTVTFAFNRAELTAETMAILDKQANFIRQFPEVRFKVFGHTDLVGSQGYNYNLGMRRANAVVNYLVGKGISRSRLEAVVSYGKTRPIIQTNQPEQRNRRTVTEVSGFVSNHPMVLNGKYAAVIWKTYTTSLAERPHPENVVIETQTNPSTN